MTFIKMRILISAIPFPFLTINNPQLTIFKKYRNNSHYIYQFFIHLVIFNSGRYYLNENANTLPAP